LVGGGAQQGGRIGQERDAAEEQQVEQDQPPVQALDATEQRVVGHPEQPDHGEADREPADLGEGLPELPAGLEVGDVGHPQVDDQQGDRDGEDGVAEEQDPVVLELPGSGEGAPALGGGWHGGSVPTRPATLVEAAG
jgi:hypothetical protein